MEQFMSATDERLTGRPAERTVGKSADSAASYATDRAAQAGTDAGSNSGLGTPDGPTKRLSSTNRFPSSAVDKPGSRPLQVMGSSVAIFVLAAALIGGILAWIWAVGQGERYSASAVVQVQPSAAIQESGDVVDVVESLDRGTIVVTAAGLANSGLVDQAAQDSIAMTEDEAQDYEVESLQVLTSHLIDINVTGPDRDRAIAYADAIAKQLGTDFSTTYPVYEVKTVTPAGVPDSSGRPGVLLIVLAAMLAAAVGAFMLWLALFGGSDERTDLPVTRRV